MLHETENIFSLAVNSYHKVNRIKRAKSLSLSIKSLSRKISLTYKSRKKNYNLKITNVRKCTENSFVAWKNYFTEPYKILRNYSKK